MTIPIPPLPANLIADEPMRIIMDDRVIEALGDISSTLFWMHATVAIMLLTIAVRMK